MRTALAIGMTAVVVFVLGASALSGQQPAPASKVKPVDANVREAYQERVKAARDVVASIDQRLEAGEALTPAMIELQAATYKRLADAESEAAPDRAGRVTAAGQHIRRCELLLNVTDERFKAGLDVSTVQVNQAKYHLADAKVMLAEAMAP